VSTHSPPHRTCPLAHADASAAASCAIAASAPTTSSPIIPWSAAESIGELWSLEASLTGGAPAQAVVSDSNAAAARTRIMQASSSKRSLFERTDCAVRYSIHQ
jgi:hypothetical protein